MPLKQPPIASSDATAWRRPPGVAVGTWRYVHQGSIAEHYDAFVADTPLCRLDEAVARAVFPPKTETLESAHPDWVLDLGCGTGRTATVLAEQGYGVLAIDLSQPMLREVVRRRLDRVLPLRMNLAQLDALQSGVAVGAVCLFSTLGMIQGRVNRRAVLREVARIVSPGAPLLLHVHSRYASLSQHGGLRLLGRSLLSTWIRSDREFGDAVYPYRGLPDMFLHRFSYREITGDLKATGWQIDRCERLTLDGASIIASHRTLLARPQLAGGYLILARSNSGSTPPRGGTFDSAGAKGSSSHNSV